MSLLGIDVGTTGVRAGVFDEGMRLLAEASEACPYEATAAGRAEASADAWWEKARLVCARVGGVTPLAKIDAVGVTGQAPTAVLVDADDRPLRRAILWLDVRADREARALERSLGPGRAESISGNRMHAYFLGPKLAWLRTHEPGVLDRAALVLQSHAFLVRKLTGEAACDRSTAMLCAPLFDARAGAWSEEGARAVGVAMHALPRIALAHEVVGRVTREAAQATGLREGTPVVAGGGDFAASALGAGVVDEGQACLMLGTAGNLLLPTRSAHFDRRLIGSHHVGCDRWLLLGGTLCGAALEWFRAACAPGLDWVTLEKEAAGVEVGARGLVVLPYLQGERTPVWDEHARGVFFGIDLTHHRGHMYRAMLEGIALGFRHCLEVAQESGVCIGSVIAANGAGKSALLRQTLADALGVPVRWTPDASGADGASGTASPASTGTLRGAAILAGLGCGVLRDAVGGPIAGTAVDAIVHLPNPLSQRTLDAVFARRIALWDALRTLSTGDRAQT